jgi:hypothetical protein
MNPRTTSSHAGALLDGLADAARDLLAAGDLATAPAG